MSLPATPLLLLGPGPSPVSSRVMAALGAPARSHLDPDLTKLLDDIRSRLTRVFRAPEDAVTLAISGTGTSGMEAVAANLVEPGRHALVVVNGYFGDRLAGLMARYGATVDRLEGEWGRAISPDAVAGKLLLRLLRPWSGPRRNVHGRGQSRGRDRRFGAPGRRADGR